MNIGNTVGAMVSALSVRFSTGTGLTNEAKMRHRPDHPLRESPFPAICFRRHHKSSVVRSIPLRQALASSPGSDDSSGKNRALLLRKAHQIEMAAKIDVWLSSPGLRPPT